MRRRVNSAPSPDNRTAGRRRGGFRALLQEMATEIRAHRSTALVYVTLRVLVIVTMVLQFLNGNYENVFLCLLTLVLFLVPRVRAGHVQGGVAVHVGDHRAAVHLQRGDPG